MLQELTNKIKKIIPEIEELDYKCRVRHNGINKSYWELIMLNKNEEPFEIIGRDITLEDLLRCIGEMEDQNKLGDYIIGGQFFTILNNEADDYEELFSWKLGNPLHEQSEETIKTLNKLI